MAAAVQTLDDDPSTRLTVRTEQSMEAEIPEGKGVYYDGTYILQFASEEEKDVASSALEDNGAKVSADTVLTICGDEAVKEKNAEQTESTPAKNTETEYVVSSEPTNEGDMQSSGEETEIIESSEEEPAKEKVEANAEDPSKAGMSGNAKATLRYCFNSCNSRLYFVPKLASCYSREQEYNLVRVRWHPVSVFRFESGYYLCGPIEEFRPFRR